MIETAMGEVINKYVQGEYIRKFIFFGKVYKNPMAKYIVVIQIDGKKCRFPVTEEEYELLEIEDYGQVDYELISNTYVLKRFGNKIVK